MLASSNKTMLAQMPYASKLGKAQCKGCVEVQRCNEKGKGKGKRCYHVLHRRLTNQMNPSLKFLGVPSHATGWRYSSIGTAE
jgi:hypothetical protein